MLLFAKIEGHNLVGDGLSDGEVVSMFTRNFASIDDAEYALRQYAIYFGHYAVEITELDGEKKGLRHFRSIDIRPGDKIEPLDEVMGKIQALKKPKRKVQR